MTTTNPFPDQPTDRKTPTKTGKRAQRSVHFSSRTNLWATPRELFSRLDAEFGFDTDVCALPENTKCHRYFTPEINGLAMSWTGSCWMNPPYGREIASWTQKAFESAKKGATVVCLLPARPDTRWWHDYVMRAHEIRFVVGRVKFGNAANSAPFPSAVVVFRPGIAQLQVTTMPARVTADKRAG